MRGEQEAGEGGHKAGDGSRKQGRGRQRRGDQEAWRLGENSCTGLDDLREKHQGC